MATAPLDMRVGTDSALARVVAVFGAAQPHHAYVFANRSSNGYCNNLPFYLYPFCTVGGTQQYKVGVTFGLF